MVLDEKRTTKTSKTSKENEKQPRIHRHSLKGRFLEVFEVFAVRIFAAGLSGLL
jgi:hypothetical protein